MVHLKDALRDASLFHEALGRCLNNWQKVEEQLFVISWSMGLHEAFAWASTFYTHVRAFDQKCALVDKLANLTLKDTPELATWGALLKRLTSCGKKRDRLVHYAIEYGKNNQYRIEPPPYAIKKKKQFTKKPPKTDGEHYFDTEQLNKIAESYSTLALDLANFYLKATGRSHELKISLQEDFWRRMGLLSNTETLQEALVRLQRFDRDQI